MSEATCKGSYLLGSACGHCSRCALELSAAKESQDLLAQLYAKDAEIAELQAKLAKAREALKVAQDIAIKAMNTPPPSDLRWAQIADALAEIGGSE